MLMAIHAMRFSQTWNYPSPFTESLDCSDGFVSALDIQGLDPGLETQCNIRLSLIVAVNGSILYLATDI